LHEIIKTAVDAARDKKFQGVRKAVQLSRPIRQRQRQRPPQRWWQFRENLKRQVVDLGGMMEDLCALRIIEKIYQSMVVLPLKNLRWQMFQRAFDAHRPPP
jgi:hypothetical protein